MADFSGAQELGGVYVKIGADLSGLQAGVAQAKTLASSVSGIRANVPLLMGPGQVGGGSAGIGNSGVNTGNLLMLPGGSAVPPYSGANTGTATYGGDYFEGEVLSSRMSRQLFMSGPNIGGGGGGGYDGGMGDSSPSPGGASGWGWGKKIKGLKGMKTIGGIFAAIAAVETASAGVNAFQAFNESNAQRREELIAAGQDSIRSIPYVGGLIGKLGTGIYSLGSATKNLVAGNGFRTDYGIAERTMDAVKMQEAGQERTARRINEIGAYNSEAVSIGRSARSENAAFGKTPEEAAAIAARDDRDEYNKRTLGINTQDVRETRAALGTRAANLSGAAGAASLAKIEDRLQRENDWNANLAEGINRRGAESLDIGRESRFVIGQAGRAANGDTYGMARAGIIEKYRGKFASAEINAGPGAMDDLIGAQNAELGAVDSARRRQTEQSVTSSNAEANQARLRQNREFYQADLAAFDEAARQKIESMRGMDAGAINSAQASLSTQRGALVASQKFDRSERIYSYGGRINAANARGEGMERLAGVREMISGMGHELRTAAPNEQPQLRSTQVAELQAVKNSLLLPTHYATELNRGFEAPGGPSGKDGAEMPKVLKALADAINNLVKNGIPANVS